MHFPHHIICFFDGSDMNSGPLWRLPTSLTSLPFINRDYIELACSVYLLVKYRTSILTKTPVYTDSRFNLILVVATVLENGLVDYYYYYYYWSKLSKWLIFVRSCEKQGSRKAKAKHLSRRKHCSRIYIWSSINPVLYKRDSPLDNKPSINLICSVYLLMKYQTSILRKNRTSQALISISIFFRQVIDTVLENGPETSFNIKNYSGCILLPSKWLIFYRSCKK